MNLVYVAVGGGVGCVCRYAFSTLISRCIPAEFPAGTFSVNLAGCLLIGLLYGIFSTGGVVDEKLRMLLFIGFLGGFTTFSSFAFENMMLLQNGSYLTFAAYVLTSNIAGILAVFGGLYISHLLK